LDAGGLRRLSDGIRACQQRRLGVVLLTGYAARPLLNDMVDRL
jgi:hypothetical protein